MRIIKKSRKRIQALILSSILLSGAAISAHAEYYLVYPGSGMYTACQSGCGGGCYSTCNACDSCSTYTTYYFQTPVQYFHYSSPRRHYHTGSGEMAPYAWISD